jgi:hypothetical protein
MKADLPHPINDEKFTTNVLTSSAGKKNDWSSKVYGVAPTPSGNALRNLAEAYRIGQQLLIPGKR